MKKCLLLSLFISLKLFGQSITIAPTNATGTPNGVVSTATSKIGLEHTDGIIRLNTYIGTSSQIGGWLQTYTAHPLVLSTSNGNAQLFLNNTGHIILNPSDGKVGNVGIGIEKLTAPSYKLDINGRSRIRHNGDTAGWWFNRSDNTEGAFTGMFNNDVYGFFGMGTVANWRFGFDLVNTKMGIGSMTPKHPLTFPDAIGDKISFWGGNTLTTDNHYGVGIQAAALQFYVPSASENIVFGTGRSGSFSEKVRIAGSGNVGIGIPNPLEKLHVSGNIRASSLVGSGTRSIKAQANGTLTAAPQTYTVIIPPQAFQRRFNTGTGRFVAGGSYAECKMEGAGASDHLVAPAILPVGAVITDVNFYFTDVDEYNNLRLMMTKTQVSSTFSEVVITLFRNTENNNPTDVTVAVSGTLNVPVAEDDYFQIVINPANTTNTAETVWNNQMSVKGVKIVYTL